jgi:signal transduction histidine kinase
MSKTCHLLILDDEENILKSIQRIFMGDSFEIAATSDPQEAFKILAKEKIKVVLSDYRMPTITGVQFLKHVKEQYPDTVRILFTGYADVSTAEEAINISHVYRFVNKPWNVGELKGVIYQAMQYYDLVVENRKLFESTIEKNEQLEIVNRKLKAMYELQKDFSSTISHELRTPLASIKLAVDIVLSGTAGVLTDYQKDFLTKAKLSVDRLKLLIDDILDLSKLEYGGLKLNKQPFDVNALIKETVQIHEALAKDHGLELKASLALTLPHIPIDHHRINQVINNLIINAINYTETGEIELITKMHEDTNYVEICVCDTGIGIDENDVSKLFRKFQQLGDPAKRKTGGTGLGLAICKEIIEQHGGKIWVKSKKGQGSQFYFVLPLVNQDKQEFDSIVI